MLITLSCKGWGRIKQYGFRLTAATIRELASIVNRPDVRGLYADLGAFLDIVNEGRRKGPDCFSRPGVITRPGFEVIAVRITFAALPPSSVQGYITAPRGSWLETWIKDNVGYDVKANYELSGHEDFIIFKDTVFLDKTPPRRSWRRIKEEAPL